MQGGQVAEDHIVPDLARLENSGVTLTDLVNAVQNSNIIESPGLYQANHELILALVGAQAHDIAHLASLVVKTTAAGAPVRVSDFAEVIQAPLPVYTYVSANGHPAVLLNIARQPSSNTVNVADGVAAAVQQLRTRAAPRRRPRTFLRPVANCPREYRQRARRHHDRPGLRLRHSFPLPARLALAR